MHTGTWGHGTRRACLIDFLQRCACLTLYHSPSQKRETIVKRLTAAIILGLASLLLAAQTAVAQAPEVTASEVVDRETLQAFVEAAKETLESATNFSEVASLVGAFRSPMEGRLDVPHRSTLEGVVQFHGADLTFEDKTVLDLEDAHGTKIVQEILAAAAAGGGFVEYHWDNPAVEGDEDIHSPKLTYAIPIKVFGQDFVVAAGIYLDAATAVEGRSWGQLKSRF